MDFGAVIIDMMCEFLTIFAITFLDTHKRLDNMFIMTLNPRPMNELNE